MTVACPSPSRSLRPSLLPNTRGFKTPYDRPPIDSEPDHGSMDRVACCRSPDRAPTLGGQNEPLREGLRPQIRLMCAFLRLVLGERFGGVNSTQTGVVGYELRSRLDPEAERKHRPERRDLHLPEARESADAAAEIGRVHRFAPHPLGVPAVLGRDDRAEFLDPPRHRAREAVDRRLLTERGFELDRVHRGDPTGVERPD